MTVLALLRRSILALPLEEIRTEKAILVAVCLGMSPLIEGHEKEDIITFDDESGLPPGDGPKFETEEPGDLLA